MNIVSHMSTESRPVKWVFDEFLKDNLYVDESFQRHYVWTNKDKVSLIETILLRYPIPEIYLWTKETNPDSSENKFSIVDGQQRIRTIRQFIEGNLILTEPGLEFKEANYKRKRFQDLNDQERSSFWAYPISIRFIRENVELEAIRKMFLRLNKSSQSLNPQELRNAEFDGEFLKASEDVASLSFWRKWQVFSDRQLRRMADVQFASSLLMFIRRGFEDETTQTAINTTYELLNDSYPDKASNIEQIEETLKFLDEIIHFNPSLEAFLRKNTHLYSLFTLCFQAKGRPDLHRGDFSARLAQWFSWHDGGRDIPQEWVSRVAEYRTLSQEGVGKKSNRHRRYQLLCEFTGV
jgi:hypothetical protein